MTHSREKYVAFKMIEKWLASGLTEEQVALRWNQGNTGTCRRGINSKGVSYDSCAYQAKVMAYLR